MKDAQQIAHELGAEIQSLSEELRAAATHFHLFKALRDAVPEFQTELNRAPLFWSFTRHAHLQAAAISLCRIYDQDRGSSNFSRFLENVQNNLPLFDREQFWERNKGNLYDLTLIGNARRPCGEEMKADIEFCSDKNPHVATLMNWRHNSIAHKNRRIILGRAAFLESDPLTYEAIHKLIQEGYRILNFYSILFQGEDFGSFPQKQLNDYQDVLRALKNAPSTGHARANHDEQE